MNILIIFLLKLKKILKFMKLHKIYIIVKFLHLKLPKEYNKNGNDDFNTLNNFINSRSSSIVDMNKKE